MPLPPPPANLLAQIQAKKGNNSGPVEGTNNNALLLAAIQKRQAASATANDGTAHQNGAARKKAPEECAPPSNIDNKNFTVPTGKLFIYSSQTESFQFDLTSPNAVQPHLSSSLGDTNTIIIVVPLAPCIYRMTDYTYSKKESILLSKCVNKLGVLRCLARECKVLNKLLEARLVDYGDEGVGTIEESELGKVRFMELLSNCGVYQKISELIISKCNVVSDNRGLAKEEGEERVSNKNTVQVVVEGLSEFLQTIEELVPTLATAREEIATTQTVSFHPGLGELFQPGAQLICHPDGMEGTPLGVSCVQSWYDEEVNRATNKVKRRFILVVEFVVSVGTELVFVAASEVYPEFHDVNRSVPIRDLNHRRIEPTNNEDDASLIQRLQERGEFYASVSVLNHYLEYHPNAFFPVVGGWGNNAVRPLSKSGRVMVDVHRGQLEGHIPIRGSQDGMSDTVKEAMKLFDQSKRTGVAVPFRTAILPEFTRGGSVAKSLQDGYHERVSDSDRHHLWMAWPMLTGFSFTARCWGKLLLSLPKTPTNNVVESSTKESTCESSVRLCTVRMGVQTAALGGVGRCGNVNYIKFQEKAFDQLVLAEDKKELIRAVARNAGGNSKYDSESDDDDDDDDEIGLDVVANKGAASIFLLSGPPGCVGLCGVSVAFLGDRSTANILIPIWRLMT